MLGGGHHGTDILVRAGRLLGDAAGLERLRIRIPCDASSSMILRPLQRLRAAWRDNGRPARWHAEENALSSALASPTRMYEPVPMLPPINTG